MIKLSEIIKTDCYIDCGTNEKLREVYPLIEFIEAPSQKKYGMSKSHNSIRLHSAVKVKYTWNGGIDEFAPTHHISQIDLNA